MAKKNVTMRVLVSPTPAVIAAAYDETGKADACTLAFYAPISHVPPCVIIGINATKKRKTLKSILSSGAFTIGYPSVDQVKEVDYLGMESGYDTDKLAKIGFSATEGQTQHAPVIDQMKLSLECKVVHTVTVGSHTQITGEITRIVADEAILNENGRVDLDKLKPVIYDEEGHVYRGLGELAGEAYKAGLEFKL